MPLEFTYSDPLGPEDAAVTVSLGSNAVRFGTVTLSESAELGEAATSGIEVDDPDGTRDFVGLRALVVRETSAPSNNQIVLSGITQDRKISRDDSLITGTARRWSIDLTDYNWHLGSRIHVDADAKRPAETAGDRIRWLLTNAAHIKYYDYGNVVYPSTQLDACDYRGQRPIDLLADCAVEGGYLFWVSYNEARRKPELFFIDPDGSSYASTARISNDLSDSGSLTYQPNEGAELTRSPSRLAFGVYLAYANGAVYVRNDTTGAQFGKIDQAAPMSNVKREARARRVATKFLNDHDEESDKVTCSVYVPAAEVNTIRAGHRIDVKFTHFPGWEAFRPCRVLRRSVSQPMAGGGYYGDNNEESVYRIDLDLVPIGASTSCAILLSTAETATNDADEYDSPGTVAITTTPGLDGTAFAFLAARNGNTPDASDMAEISGYTTLVNEIDAGGGGTFTIASKAVTSGASTTASASFTRGFGFAGTIAIHLTLGSGLSVVQDKYSKASATATLDSAPTAGNTILMFGFSTEITTFSPGGDGPTSGWSEVAYVTHDSTASRDFNCGIFGRCVVEGDDTVYGITGGSAAENQKCVYVVELAIA